MKINIDRIILFPTIAILALISLADLLGILDESTWFTDRIPTITLLLLTLVIAFWLNEQEEETEQLNEIKRLVALSAIDARVMESTEEAMDYLAQRYLEATQSIDQAAIAPSLSPANSYANYDQALVKVLRKNTVKYRHVTLLDQTRWRRVRNFLTDQRIQKYYVSYFEASSNQLPGISYAVIDDEEVVLRYPYSPGERELWLSAKSPDVLEVFKVYYRTLWNAGEKLPAVDSARIEHFDREYGVLAS